jgi:2-dehydropantoate 2-reductase
MACLFGGRLARAGHAVTLAGTWLEGLAALALRGVTVEDAGGSWSTPVRTARLHDSLPESDLVLVLVKSYRTAAIAPEAARAADGGLIATLQNGLGNREALEAAGASRVLVGVTAAGATLLGPGHVRGHIAGTVLGDDGHGAAGSVARLLRSAGLEAELAGDIERLLWRKLVVNCAINPLTALLGVENGALLANPEWRARMEAAAREAGAVARAKGVALGEDAIALAVSAAQATAGNHSSMLQDLSRGARTEIEAINGAVLREGRRLGVATPVNEELWAAVLAREAGARPRGRA